MLRQESSWAHHSVRSAVPFFRSASTAASRSTRTSLQSPTIGTSARRFFPISAGSMSACTIFAPGANVASCPVTRSSKRAPSAISRSAFCSAPTAETLPCMPGMPTCCGWLSGNAPSAISVVTTGMLVSSASSRSSAQASALSTPPPTYSTGRRAAVISLAASRICLPCGRVVGR